MSDQYSYEQIVEIWEENYLPSVSAQYEQDGQIDGPARRESFNNMTDMMCCDGIISEETYETMDGLPDSLDS